MSVPDRDRRYYTQKQLERAARQIEFWRESLALAYRRELCSLAKTASRACETLEREIESFAGERSIARKVIEQDVPPSQRWLNAALHILDFGSAAMRADFIVGDDATRERLVQWVITNGGIYDRTSGRKNPAWIGALE
jgi:hypothetical protein